jgi:poly(A) polymerase
MGRELAASIGGRLVTLDDARDIVRVVAPGDLQPLYVDISSLVGGLDEDLRRRDFTIDAMAVSLAEASGMPWSNVIDPLGGRVDLEAGVIRAVSLSAFRDDPAWLMRAPRLAAQLGFTIAEDTALQIQREAPIVSAVAPERVRDEFLRTLASPGVASSLRLLDSLGLLCRVIPELADAKGVTQPREHYWDVFNHLIETAGQVERIIQGTGYGVQGTGDSRTPYPEPRTLYPTFEGMAERFAEEVSDGHTRLALLKLAGLLHDIAKPATRSVESTGRIRFLGHHTLGAEVSAGILRRLRFSGRGVELVRLLVLNHLRPTQMAQSGELPTGKAIYRYFRDAGDAAIDTLYLNMADFLAARGPMLREDEWAEHCRVIGYILREGLERRSPETLPTLIDGHDIIERFALSPGPEIGKLLRLAREAQANGEVTTKEEALELVRANLNSGGGDA